MSLADELKKLHDLKSLGIISAEEFNAEKQRLFADRNNTGGGSRISGETPTQVGAYRVMAKIGDVLREKDWRFERYVRIFEIRGEAEAEKPGGMPAGVPVAEIETVERWELVS